jgi:hypothetical protein
VIVEHTTLGPERGENPGKIDRSGSSYESEISGDARVVHREDIEATEST